METDLDLPDLIRGKDHLNVLRYVRVHQLRKPELVVEHGKYLLGENLNRKLRTVSNGEMVRLAALEQICLSALDCGQMKIAELCLDQLKISGKIDLESNRFRLLLGRCLEADGDSSGAVIIYNDLLKENPSNLMALKRKYCVLKSQPGKIVESVTALNEYLQQNYSDTSAWYECAKLRMELGDYKGAAFCFEEVMIGTPSSANIHCELAECYATVGTLDDLFLARKHIAQALELDPTLLRAQIGLVTVSNAYLQQTTTVGKKHVDEFEVEVAKELVRYGTEQVMESYNGTNLYTSMKTLMNEYTDNL
jgi:ER membrane protein complex subunit 2